MLCFVPAPSSDPAGYILHASSVWFRLLPSLSIPRQMMLRTESDRIPEPRSTGEDFHEIGQKNLKRAVEVDHCIVDGVLPGKRPGTTLSGQHFDSDDLGQLKMGDFQVTVTHTIG